MRTGLRVAALLIALGVTVFWLFGGPNIGWTKDRVLYEEKDEVTGLVAKRYKDQYVPGVDFLAKGLAMAGVIACCSFFFRRSKQPSAS